MDDVVERFNRQVDADRVRRLVREVFPPEIARVLNAEIDTGLEFRWLTPQPKWLRLLQEIRDMHAQLQGAKGAAA